MWRELFREWQERGWIEKIARLTAHGWAAAILTPLGFFLLLMSETVWGIGMIISGFLNLYFVMNDL